MKENIDQAFALDARFYVKLGITLLRDKQAVEEAVRAFQTALEYEPECQDALLHLAACNLFQNRKREARRILKQIQKQSRDKDKLNTAREELWFNFIQFGSTLDDKARYANQEKVLRCVLELAPDSPLVLMDLARCYRVQGRKQEQLKTIMTAIRIAKGTKWLVDAHEDLCKAYYRYDNKKLALRQIEILAGLDPERAARLRRILFDEDNPNTWENNWNDEW
jgi:tetratricopeptide (TPR) repeat protein